MFRNPKYLDVSLLQNLADYNGIDLAVDSQVTRSEHEESPSEAPTDGPAANTGRIETRTFSTPFRPVRAFNDVVDAMLRDGTAKHVSVSASVEPRQVIEIEGDLGVSPATEVGALMERFLPLMLRHAAESGPRRPSDREIAQAFMAEGTATPQLYEINGDDLPVKFVTVLDPSHLFRSTSMEDLEGDVSIFGLVDRVVREGAEVSLERHVLPGLNRTIRRALGSAGSIENLLEGSEQVLGRRIDPESVKLRGPAAFLTTVAVY